MKYKKRRLRLTRRQIQWEKDTNPITGLQSSTIRSSLTKCPGSFKK